MTEAIKAARLSELAEVLSQYGSLGCALDVDHGGDELIITVRLDLRSITALELGHQLEFLAGAASVRAFASKYDITIPSEVLDALIVSAQRRQE